MSSFSVFFVEMYNTLHVCDYSTAQAKNARTYYKYNMQIIGWTFESWAKFSMTRYILAERE
jgi:hypothetical protein